MYFNQIELFVIEIFLLCNHRHWLMFIIINLAILNISHFCSTHQIFSDNTTDKTLLSHTPVNPAVKCDFIMSSDVIKKDQRQKPHIK